MKIELYLIPNDQEGKLLEEFLKRNNLFFRKFIMQGSSNKISFLRIKYSSSINIINGFNPFMLKHLLEHIKKYHPKLK